VAAKITDIDVYVGICRLTRGPIRHIVIETLARRPDGVYLPRRVVLGVAPGNATSTASQQLRWAYIKDLSLKGLRVEGISPRNLEALTASLFSNRVRPAEPVASLPLLKHHLRADPDAVYCIVPGDTAGLPAGLPVHAVRWRAMTCDQLTEALADPGQQESIIRKIQQGLVRFGITRTQQE
jgi:hypothetical protein